MSTLPGRHEEKVFLKAHNAATALSYAIIDDVINRSRHTLFSLNDADMLSEKLKSLWINHLQASRCFTIAENETTADIPSNISQEVIINSQQINPENQLQPRKKQATKRHKALTSGRSSRNAANEIVVLGDFINQPVSVLSEPMNASAHSRFQESIPGIPHVNGYIARPLQTMRCPYLVRLPKQDTTLGAGVDLDDVAAIPQMPSLSKKSRRSEKTNSSTGDNAREEAVYAFPPLLGMLVFIKLTRDLTNDSGNNDGTDENSGPDGNALVAGRISQIIEEGIRPNNKISVKIRLSSREPDAIFPWSSSRIQLPDYYLQNHQDQGETNESNININIDGDGDGNGNDSYANDQQAEAVLSTLDPLEQAVNVDGPKGLASTVKEGADNQTSGLDNLIMSIDHQEPSSKSIKDLLDELMMDNDGDDDEVSEGDNMEGFHAYSRGGGFLGLEELLSLEQSVEPDMATVLEDDLDVPVQVEETPIAQEEVEGDLVNQEQDPCIRTAIENPIVLDYDTCLEDIEKYFHRIQSNGFNINVNPDQRPSANYDPDTILLSMEEYPTSIVPLKEPEVIIFAKLLRIIRQNSTWKINLQGIYLRMNGKDYLFPLSKVILDTSQVWP